MTEHEIKISKEVFELPHKLELISEEKTPTLYSLSFTDSLCSDSTIDLDGFNEQNNSAVLDFGDHEKIGLKPLENNYINEKSSESIKMITPEPRNSMDNIPHSKFNKSVSLHDVSNILPLNLIAKSNTVSCETINSQSLSSTTKSKDSGFQRSISCLSLTSGRRTYDHVQSKVKAYIKNIKESESLRKRNKLLQKHEETSECVAVSVYESEDVVGKDNLIMQIQELKHELHEKSLFIDAQQRNYNKLLLKFAEAKNIIDKLRVQTLSLNYSSVPDLRHQMSSVSEVKLNHGLSNNLIVSYHADNSTRKCNLITEEKTNSSIHENFKPPNHSSPYEKSLDPVSKMFSSSSRLDRNYTPLANPKNNNSGSITSSQAQNKCNECTCDGAVKNVSYKLNNHSNLLQRESSTSINLPNDDPFDKVKKWQASLPSVNLLGTCSSSDFDEAENGSLHSNNKKSGSKSLKGNVAKNEANDSEICNLLSQELQTKCIITEMDADIVRERRTRKKKNTHVTNSSRKEKRVHNRLSNNSSAEEIKASLADNKCSPTKNRCADNKPLIRMEKPLNCNVKEDTFQDKILSSESQGGRTDFVDLHLEELSMSEGESTHQPKSSSISNRRINNFESDQDSDDSSSISSSVLGSDAPLLTASPKRRLVLCEDQMLSKVPKITKSKSCQTTFVMREPKFKFTPAFENNKSQMNNQISLNNKSTNYETWYKYRNSNTPTVGFTTESSQKKAWNARNNANFYVSKEFSFNNSKSLLECIRDMEGLVTKGSRVLTSVVERTNTF